MVMHLELRLRGVRLVLGFDLADRLEGSSVLSFLLLKLLLQLRLLQYEFGYVLTLHRLHLRQAGPHVLRFARHGKRFQAFYQRIGRDVPSWVRERRVIALRFVLVLLHEIRHSPSAEAVKDIVIKELTGGALGFLDHFLKRRGTSESVEVGTLVVPSVLGGSRVSGLNYLFHLHYPFDYFVGVRVHRALANLYSDISRGLRYHLLVVGDDVRLRNVGLGLFVADLLLFMLRELIQDAFVVVKHVLIRGGQELDYLGEDAPVV